MKTREGYLMIDHRASPGIPEDIAVQLGMDPKLVAGGKLLEVGTLTCAHCKGVLRKNPFRIRERFFCAKCGGHYICDGCAAEASLPTYSHRSFDKIADMAMKLAT